MGDTTKSYKTFEDVDLTIAWSDPTVVFTPYQFTIDTSAAFDKVLFMLIWRASGVPLTYVYRFMVCQPVVVWPTNPITTTYSLSKGSPTFEMTSQ